MNELTTNIKPITLPSADGPPIECPKFLAKISCGLFGISDDFIEKYQSLDQLFIKNKFSTFFFEASGDSMEPSIRAGQILIVDKARSDFHNHICIVAYEDRLICKRVLVKENGIILRSDNSKYRDIFVQNQESVVFWGIVIATAGFVK